MLSASTSRRVRVRCAAVLAATSVACVFTIGSASANVTGPPEPLGTDATSNGSLGPSTFLGPESRAQIVERAHDWISQGVLYSTAQDSGSDWNYWTDSATGGPYRQDCSGFVSMAWGLGSSQASFTIDASPYSTITD